MIKRGFTLAEVLICIAIIAVVSAFGGSIMKKSTANAYKMYVKSGYANLYDALAAIIDENPEIKTKADLQGQLNNIFDLKDKTTKNGIKYDVTEDNNNGCFIIEMTVPQQKTRANTNGKATAAFMFNRNGDVYLIPLNINSAGYISNLQSRTDLIPFYVDDYEVGRFDSAHGYTKITPTNYKEAACRVLGDLYVKVPSKYVSEKSQSTSVWGELENNQWNFSTGNQARIVNCTGIAQTNSGDQVVPYFGR